MYGGKGNDADPEMFGQSVDRTGMGRQRDTGGQKEEESARGRRRSGRFGSGLDSGAPGTSGGAVRKERSAGRNPEERAGN